MIVDAKTTAIERSPEILHAVEVIDWWREERARPLSRVTANLRHYAGEHEAPRVAQRLKKFPTIVDKLLRQPTMKLSRMADIGGVRAVAHSPSRRLG
jgi:putative GTP pyrophosphokinase